MANIVSSVCVLFKKEIALIEYLFKSPEILYLFIETFAAS